MLSLGESYIMGAVLVRGSVKVGLVRNRGPVSYSQQYSLVNWSKEASEQMIRGAKRRTYQLAPCGGGDGDSDANQTW